MTTRKFSPAAIDAALADAWEIGLAAAARKHGVSFSALRYHKRRRGLRIPGRPGGFTGYRKPDVNRDLAILRALFPAHVTFSLNEIADIVGGISKQSLHATEQRALRKIRHHLIEDGLFRETA